MGYYVDVLYWNLDAPENTSWNGTLFKIKNGDISLGIFSLKWHEDIVEELKQLLDLGVQGTVHFSGEEPDDFFRYSLDENLLKYSVGKMKVDWMDWNDDPAYKIPRLKYKVQEVTRNG